MTDEDLKALCDAYEEWLMCDARETPSTALLGGVGHIRYQIPGKMRRAILERVDERRLKNLRKVING